MRYVKKYGGYPETLNVIPQKGYVVSYVKAGAKKLKPVSENTYQFIPEGDTEVVISFSVEGEKQASRAGLKVKKKKMLHH